MSVMGSRCMRSAADDVVVDVVEQTDHSHLPQKKRKESGKGAPHCAKHGRYFFF